MVDSTMSRTQTFSSILRSFKNVVFFGTGIISTAYAGHIYGKKQQELVHYSTLTTWNQTLKDGTSKIANFILPTAFCQHQFDAYMLNMTRAQFEAKTSTELYQIFKARLGGDFGPHKPIHFFIVGSYPDVARSLPLHEQDYITNLIEIDYVGKDLDERLRNVMWLNDRVDVIKMVWSREADSYDFFIGLDCKVLLEVQKTGAGASVIINPIKIVTVSKHQFDQMMAVGEYQNSIEPMWILKQTLGAFYFHKRSTSPPPP